MRVFFFFFLIKNLSEMLGPIPVIMQKQINGTSFLKQDGSCCLACWFNIYYKWCLISIAQKKYLNVFLHKFMSLDSITIEGEKNCQKNFQKDNLGCSFWSILNERCGICSGQGIALTKKAICVYHRAWIAQAVSSRSIVSFDQNCCTASDEWI